MKNDITYFQHIISLYQALPRQENQAMTITELLTKPSLQAIYYDETITREAQRKKLIRHLETLEKIFPQELIIRTQGKANTYYLLPTASLENLTENTAMLLVLAESFLQLSAPKDKLQDTEPLFANAHKRLAKDKKAQNWQQRLYFSQEYGYQLPVNEDVENTVYQALQDNLPLRVTYHNQARDEIRQYEGNPVKLVVTPHRRLLILDNAKYDDTMTFLLHRVKTAEILTGQYVPTAVKLDLTKIDKEIERHTQPLLFQQPIDMVLSVPYLERYLIEDNPLFVKYTPVATLLEEGYQQYEIRQAFVTYSIVDFLVANASTVFVSEPEALQEVVIESLQAGLESYEIN